MVRGHDRDQEATSFALDHQLAIAAGETRGVVRLGPLRAVATSEVVVGESAEPHGLNLAIERRLDYGRFTLTWKNPQLVDFTNELSDGVGGETVHARETQNSPPNECGQH